MSSWGTLIKDGAEKMEEYWWLLVFPGGIFSLTLFSLNFLGAVPQCDWLRMAVQRQQAVATAYPASPSARAIAEIARRAARWEAPASPRGNIEFFVDRLLAQGVRQGAAA